LHALHRVNARSRVGFGLAVCAMPLKRALTIPQAALATLVVMLAMVALAAARLWWTARRAAAAPVAGAN
jgi:hypothetical protein